MLARSILRLRFIFVVVIVCSILVAFLLLAPARAAGSWYVIPSGNDNNSCMIYSNPCRTINGAINKASSGDTIYVATGTYTSTVGDDVVLINKDVTLSGGWDAVFAIQAGRSVIDGQGARRGIYVSFDVNAKITRFLIENGRTGHGGGGIQVVHGELLVDNSIIRNNYAYAGGGGISNLSYSTLHLINTTISGNFSPQWGGGIYSDFSTIIIENSTVSKNRTDSGGGGIIKGGDIGSLTLYNASITRNSASQGGGIYALGGGVTLYNSIVADNKSFDGPDCKGNIDSGGYNLISSNSGCNITSTTGDLVNVDPGLGVFLEDFGYQTILPESLAVNGGNPAGCAGSIGFLPNDQRGVSRVGNCDIGAYEYTIPGTPKTFVAYSGTPQSTAPLSAFQDPLQALVVDGIGTPVNGIDVLFSAPSSGPSGVFTSTGTTTYAVLTDSGGLATSSLFVANEQKGDYFVTATITGNFVPVQFSLANNIWFVSPGGNDGNDCQSPSTPCATIYGVQKKLDYRDGDTVHLASGTYTGTDTQVMLLAGGMRLIGGWDPSFTAQDGFSVVDGEATREGIVVETNATAVIKRFVIRNATNGIRNQKGIVFLDQVQIEKNSSTGIYNVGVLRLDNSSINTNGGGIYNELEAYINNSTISGNYTSGGIRNYGGLIITNSTITGNSTSWSGGGIYNWDSTLVQLHNTLLAGNTATSSDPDCSGNVASMGYNLIGDPTGCNFSGNIGDLLGTNPLLRPLIGLPGYQPLQNNSPAIDKGDPDGCKDELGIPIVTDQRGSARVGRCDIGAVEWNPLDATVKLTDVLQAPPGSKVAFRVILSNPGENDIVQLVVTDMLPAELIYIQGTLQASSGAASYANGVITWTGTLAAGNTISIYYDAILDSGAMLNSHVTNLVNLHGNGLVSDIAVDLEVNGQICNATKYSGNPVLVPGAPGTWDSAGVWDPSVLKVNGLYRMWYSGTDGTTTRIGYATSQDGVSWTKHPGNPVFSAYGWNGSNVSDPNVVYQDSFGNPFSMWYVGTGFSGKPSIWFVGSSDGINWPSRDVNPKMEGGASGSWDSEGAFDPTVIINNNSYYNLWYSGSDGASTRLGRASSWFGNLWDKDVSNPVLDLGELGAWDWLDIYGPSVIKYANNHLLFYSGWSLPLNYQIGVAISSNGSDWSRQGAIIPQGEAGAFDEFGAEYPSALLDNSAIKIWYSGWGAAAKYSIGYATVGLCPVKRPSGYSTFLPVVHRGISCTVPGYHEGFSDPYSGWLNYNDPYYKFGYVGGEYQIQILSAQDGNAVTPGAKAADFTALVTARKVSGTGAYGIVFGIDKNWDQFYEVLLSDATFSVWMYNNGWTKLKDWTSSPHINGGTGTNRLKVARVGSIIDLYVNDQYLATLIDGTLTGVRRIGLVAESDSQPVDVRFDDFALFSASCGAGVSIVHRDKNLPVVSWDITKIPDLTPPGTNDEKAWMTKLFRERLK